MKARSIAVVGAGPAGLAVALYLHRAGHRVTIFERFEEVRPIGSGLILQPTGLTVLHDLGLLDAILALGARIDRLHGTDARSGRTVLDVRYDALRGGRFGMAVHRAALFGVLHTAVLAAGIPIETGTDIVDCNDGRLIGADGSERGSFELIVDASGARSVLRARCEVPGEPRPLAYGAFWASLDWCGEGFDAHALTQRYDKASVMIGVLPIGRVERDGPRKAAFFWSIKPNEAPAVQARGLAAWKERIIALWPQCAAYTDQISSFEHLTLARYGHHTLARPIGSRLAIIGDAAHSTSPQLGQGANMALLDAKALAHALDSSADMESALLAYMAARRRHVRVFQMLSRMFTPFYQSDSTLLPFMRDRLVATLARIPPGPQILASLVAGAVVDPFGSIGLKEADWMRVGTGADTDTQNSVARGSGFL